MFNDTIQLYPTPRHIITKLIEDIDFRTINTCLEPSIGMCSIAEVLNDKLRFNRSNQSYWNDDKKDHKNNIDGCEISKSLQVLAKDKGYRIVADDFLKYHTYKHYDLIVANPPFNEGEKHALHIIELAEQNNGSKIRCILNAETLKNPYSNHRQLLIQKIEQYQGKIEYIQDAFIDSENKTGVEIAIVKLDIVSQGNSIILDHLEKEKEIELEEVKETYEVGQKNDYVTAICAKYQDEIKATVKLIKEYHEISKIMLQEFKENSSPILELRIHGRKDYSYNSDILNDTIKEIRYKYWKAFLNSDNLSNLMTSNIRTQWHEKLTDLKEYDFTPFNVRQVELDIKMSLSKGIEQTILDLFDKFTKYAMQDGSKNIHMFTGWKSNNAYKLDKKVILPYIRAYDEYSGRLEVSYKIMDTLRDIEKTFTYIDSGVLQLDHVQTEEELKFNFGYGETKNIELTYFKIDFYKKGTAHLKFDDKYKNVLDRFNYIACSLRGELPNSFAKKQYKDMSKDEKTVVKAYCGSEKAYSEDVMSKQELYDFSINNMKLLA